MWKEIWSGTKFWQRALRGRKAKLRSHYVMRTQLLKFLYNVQRLSWRGLRFRPPIACRWPLQLRSWLAAMMRADGEIYRLNQWKTNLFNHTNLEREMNINFYIFLNVWGLGTITVNLRCVTFGKVEYKESFCFYIAILLNPQYYPVQKHLSHI